MIERLGLDLQSGIRVKVHYVILEFLVDKQVEWSIDITLHHIVHHYTYVYNIIQNDWSSGQTFSTLYMRASV